MKTVDIPVIALTGTPRERGRVYGETARPLIAQVMEAWRDRLGNYEHNNATVKNDNPEAYLTGFLSETGFLPSIEKWAPAFLEDVRGIAEGAGKDFNTLLALQLLDEEWVPGKA